MAAQTKMGRSPNRPSLVLDQEEDCSLRERSLSPRISPRSRRPEKLVRGLTNKTDRLFSKWTGQSTDRQLRKQGTQLKILRKDEADFSKQINRKQGFSPRGIGNQLRRAVSGRLGGLSQTPTTPPPPLLERQKSDVLFGEYRDFLLGLKDHGMLVLKWRTAAMWNQRKKGHLEPPKEKILFRYGWKLYLRDPDQKNPFGEDNGGGGGGGGGGSGARGEALPPTPPRRPPTPPRRRGGAAAQRGGLFASTPAAGAAAVDRDSHGSPRARQSSISLVVAAAREAGARRARELDLHGAGDVRTRQVFLTWELATHFRAIVVEWKGGREQLLLQIPGVDDRRTDEVGEFLLRFREDAAAALSAQARRGADVHDPKLGLGWSDALDSL